ncbi:MAG: hypothetical protein OSA24_02050 [Longimicrobiales bacterium]|nr:hypothetical protein [Longimicrobiales bacterium]
MSTPAVVPHSLPSGRSPQFVMTDVVGFTRPSPVMRLPLESAVTELPDGAHPAIPTIATTMIVREEY